MTQWTAENPTKPGYYWLRNYQFNGERMIEKPSIVHIFDSAILPLDSFTFTGNEADFRFADLFCGEWLGPLEPGIGVATVGTVMEALFRLNYIDSNIDAMVRAILKEIAGDSR